MHGNALREKLAAGKWIVNVMVPFASPTFVEMLSYSDVDVIMLDAEHGAINESQCEDMIRAADVAGKPIWIRVPHNDPHTILRFLEIGASGLIVPHVNTPEDARRAVEAMKYGPEGSRSSGAGRAAAFGAREPMAEYIRRANREVLVIALFEDIAGLESVTDILNVAGVDALIVGPADLAFSMGHPAQPWNAEVQKVVDQIIAACQRAGKPTGLPASDAAHAREHISRGCQIISVGVAGLVLGSARQLVADIRGA